jgi:hypothetical protein
MSFDSEILSMGFAKMYAGIYARVLDSEKLRTI